MKKTSNLPQHSGVYPWQRQGSHGFSLALTVSTLVLTACINAPPYTCVIDEKCKYDAQPPGICVLYAGITGYCAFPAGDCASGFRYDRSADPILVDKCATLPQFDVVGPTMSVNEHEPFDVHVTVHDMNGQKLTTYAGKPTFTSTWGDLKVEKDATFVAGEADFRLSLNRETNPDDGNASVVAQDGIVKGKSAGVAVTAPAWKNYVTFVTASANIDLTGQFMSIGVRDKTYYWVGTSVNNPGKAIYTAHAKDALENIKIDETVALQSSATSVPTATLNSPSFLATENELIFGYNLFGSGVRSQIARSKNGIDWTPGTDLAVPSSTETSCTKPAFLSLFRDGDQIAMIYSGVFPINMGVRCLARSSDGGLTWSEAKKVTRNNDSALVAFVIKEGSVYKGWDQDGAYATSTDGTRWINVKPSALPTLRGVLWDETAQQYVGVYNLDKSKLQIVTRP